MKENQLSVREWIEAWNRGDFLDKDVHTQIAAGWYDWFCKDSSLATHLKRMAKKVILISQSPKIDMDSMYVWFKNNCPMDGKLYNDFRFADLRNGDVYYTIVPSCGHTSSKGKSRLWCRLENKSITGDWDDIVTFMFTDLSHKENVTKELS